VGEPEERVPAEAAGRQGMITSSTGDTGITEVVVDHPPVNALPVAGWFDLAGAVRTAGTGPGVRVVVLRAEGRGFNAGVDIKEIQASGFEALVGANRGCYAAFAAVYECPVPVIAAVHGFCLGGGIGLAGNADMIVASDDATFGLPEVERGALGAATHLSRLVPQHKARAMMYTSATATAAELHAFGSVHTVVPRAGLRDAALRLAAEVAAKDPAVIRMAKEAFNGIDPQDVRRSYRYEQGYTFELNLLGVSDRLRGTFGQGGPAGEGGPPGRDGRTGQEG
jgi:enoyl-CoA hydratase